MHISATDIDSIRLVTMRGPNGLNVFDDEAHARLGELLEAADADDGVRVIILRGTERSFSVGADVAAFPASPADPTSFVTRFLMANSLPERLRKPVLAVAEGLVVAGGFELALACDWIFATARTTFALPEARFGLVAGYAAARLARSIGSHQARRLLMTGETITAPAARELGVPVTVVADGDPLEPALAMAADIARSAPQAVRLIKQRTVAAARADDPDFTYGAATYAQLWNLPDTRGAIAAWQSGDRAGGSFRPLDDPWG